MKKSETIGKLAEALSKTQGMMQGAKKDAKNPQYNSKYATLNGVWEAIREPLSKNDLAVLQTVSDTVSANRETLVTVETVLMHKSGEWISESIGAKPVRLNKGGGEKMDIQAHGSVITYLRRYSLSAIVGGYAEDDDRQELTTIPIKTPQKIKKMVETKGEEETPEETPEEKIKRKKREIGENLLEMCNDNVREAGIVLSANTAFMDKKNNKMVEGKTSIKELSDRQVTITYPKIKKMYEQYKALEPGDKK